VQAASALAGLRQPGDFGSQELKLFSAGAANITAADANRSFFYAARLTAAPKISSQEERLDLLGNALADSPSRTDARVPYFRAAGSLQRDELALTSIEQMLQAGVVGRTFEETTSDEDVQAATDESDSGDETPASGPMPTLSPAQQAQQAQLAQEV